MSNSRVVFFLLGCIFLLAILVTLLPSIISTEWGTHQIVTLINHKIPGKVVIDKVHLQWGPGQIIEGFTLKDPEGKTIVSLEKLQTEATLWQLIRGSARLGHTKLENLTAQIKTNEKGISNLQYALGLDAENPSFTIPPSTITLTDVKIDVNLFKGQKPSSLYVSGNTQEGELMGTFEVHAILPGLQLKEWSDLGQDAQKLLSIEGSKETVLQARIKNFPVNLIDQLVALKNPKMKGLFYSLLGDKINVALDKESSLEGLAFNLTALSPSMQANIKVKALNKQIILQAPAIIHLDLRPESLNWLTAQHFEIVNQTRLEVVLDELAIPFAFIESRLPADPCQLSLKGSSRLQTPAKVKIFPLGEANISNLQANFELTPCQDIIHFQIMGQAQQQGQEPFNLSFNSTLCKPLNLNDLILKMRKEFQGTLNISHFPLQWQSLSPKQRTHLELLGKHVDMQLAFKQINLKDFDLIVSLQTDSVQLAQAHFKINDTIQLTRPLSFEYLIHPANIAPFLAPYGLQLTHSEPLVIAIQKLTLPLSASKNGQFNVKATIDSLQLDQERTSHLIQIQNALLNIEGHSLSEINAQVSMKLFLPESENHISSIIGKQAQLQASSHMTIDSDGQINFSHLKTHLETEQASLHLTGRLLPSYQLILMHPLEISYKLKPALFKKITGLEDEDYPKLHNCPLIYFRADPFQINLKDFELNSLVIDGHLSVDRLMLQDAAGALTTVEQIEMPWELNGPTNTAYLNLKGQAFSHFQQKPSQLSIEIDLSNWHFQNKYDFNRLKLEINSKLTALPIPLISAFICKEDLTPLIGPAIDVDLKTLIDPEQKSPGYWDMKLDSTLFHAQARLKFEQALILYESINKLKPAAFRLTMTPEGSECLLRLLGKDSGKGAVLAESFDIKGGFTDLYLPLNKRMPILNGGRIKAEIETTDIHLKDALPFTFKFSTQLVSLNLRDQVHFESKITTAQADSHLSLKGTVSQLFDNQNYCHLEKANLDLEAEASHFPTLAIRPLLLLNPSAQQQFNILIGEEINAQAKMVLNQMNGLLSFGLQSPKSQATLKGEIRQGVLTLEKPLEWEVSMTPELSQVFFNHRFPIFNHAIAAEKPIKLTIDPRGFNFPVYPFNFKKLVISNGALDLGKIYFKNEGELKTILSLLKPIPQEELMIWFTPLFFQITEEQFKLERLDMFVANRYSLASWGRIGVDPDQKMDIILGLSAQALQYAFDIEGLSPDYMLQIPLRGKKGIFELDKAKAAARISALIAQTQGDTQTKILGNILELAVGGIQDPLPPAPTTTPFPWQQELTNYPTEKQAKSLSSIERRATDTAPHRAKKEKRLGKKLLDLLHQSS